jgi:hypothetical protein
MAMEEAAGRGRAGGTVPDDVRALACRLVEVGRRVEALPPCPAGLLRRAQAIADEVPRRLAARLGARLWALLFDSSARLAPALRGGTKARLLRYGGEGGSMDLELSRTAAGALLLRGTVDVAGEALTLDVVPSVGRPLRVEGRAGGLFEAELPAASEPVSLALRAGRRVLARIPSLPPLA